MHSTKNITVSEHFKEDNIKRDKKIRRSSRTRVASIKLSNIHVRDKKFKCDACFKSFAVPTSLYRHRKYECNNKPQFKCPHCNYQAKQTTHIYTHVKNMHPGEVEECYDMLNETLLTKQIKALRKQ